MRDLGLPPRGQALVEVLIIALLLTGILTLLSFSQDWAEQRAQSAEAIRLHAESCRLSPTNCPSEALQLMLPRGAQLTQHRLGQQHANATTLRDWSTSLRSLASHGGQSIFGLPDGNPLAVLDAQVDLHAPSRFLQIAPESLRLAVVPHDWRAIDATEAQERIRHGSEPSDVLTSSVSAAHAPSLLVLMPLTDFLGLDTQTESIRSGFHRLDPLKPAQSLGEPSS